MAAGERDDVEQVAMLAGGGVSKLAGGAGAPGGPVGADEQAAAGIVGNVAHQPVGSAAPAGGEILPAHGLSVLGKAGGEVCGVARHDSGPTAVQPGAWACCALTMTGGAPASACRGWSEW